MLRAFAATILLLALVPCARAIATIDDVQVPAQTVAERVFDARVTITNRGPAEDVVLVAALYDREEGKTCGPATDARFRAFTQLVHDPIHLPADSTIEHPSPGERWSHRYTKEETPTGGRAEWCVFVARSPGPTAQVQYEDLASLDLAVRPTNAPPIVAFTWTPERPIAASPVTFEASAADTDGDPVSLRWDFGFHNASGRAQATEGEPVVRFYPDGLYEVTLLASDGFDETSVSRQVAVLPEEGAATTVVPTKAERTPLPLWLALAAVGLAMARRH